MHTAEPAELWQEFADVGTSTGPLSTATTKVRVQALVSRSAKPCVWTYPLASPIYCRPVSRRRATPTSDRGTVWRPPSDRRG